MSGGTLLCIVLAALVAAVFVWRELTEADRAFRRRCEEQRVFDALAHDMDHRPNVVPIKKTPPSELGTPGRQTAKGTRDDTEA